MTEADKKREGGKKKKKAISEMSVTNIVGKVSMLFFLPSKSNRSSEANYKQAWKNT